PMQRRLAKFGGHPLFPSEHLGPRSHVKAAADKKLAGCKGKPCQDVHLRCKSQRGGAAGRPRHGPICPGGRGGAQRAAQSRGTLWATIETSDPHKVNQPSCPSTLRHGTAAICFRSLHFRGRACSSHIAALPQTAAMLVDSIASGAAQYRLQITPPKEGEDAQGILPDRQAGADRSVVVGDA